MISDIENVALEITKLKTGAAAKTLQSESDNFCILPMFGFKTKQCSLGKEFEKVLTDNLWDLYGT